MAMSESQEPDDGSPTLLRQDSIQQRMQCSGSVAHNIEEAFVTVGQLIDAIESDDPLTDVDGIGPKTSDVILDWWENREQREAKANSATVTKQSSRSLSISFHPSWEGALGIEVSE